MTERKIVLINQSPNRMLLDIIAQLQNDGFHCTLVCGEGSIQSSAPDRIINFAPYNRKSTLSRFTSWIKFSIQVRKWLKQNNEFTHLFLVSNPPFNIYIPVFISSLRNKTISYLVYDLYPDIFKNMLNPILTFIPDLLMSYLNRKAFKYAKTIVTPSEGLKKAVQIYTEKKVISVYNWNDTSEIKPLQPNENKFLASHKLQDKFIVLYSGNLGKTHDTETILKAAELLISNDTIAFVFIGHGEGMQKIKSTSKTMRNIYCFDWQKDELYPHSIASGNIAWISYKEGIEEFSIPSKLPALLSTGTPVIMIGKTDSELATLLTKNKIGFAVSNGDAIALAEIIRHQLEHGNKLAENCISFSANNFSGNNAKVIADAIQ